MQRTILAIFIVLTFLCSPAISASGTNWVKKANALWDGKKYTNPKKAIEYLSNFIKQKPDAAAAYYNRAIAYGQMGQHKRALADYNQTIRLKPDLAQAYINRGVIHLNQGNKKLGCYDAQKACRLKNCLLLDMAKVKGFCQR
jgi:tetratricopeptide (TPR) repeat protein